MCSKRKHREVFSYIVNLHELVVLLTPPLPASSATAPPAAADHHFRGDPTSGMLQPRHGDCEDHMELASGSWLWQVWSKLTVEEGLVLALPSDPSESSRCISPQPPKPRFGC